MEVFFERLSQTHFMFFLTSTSENTLLRIHFETSEEQVESRYCFDDSQLDVLNMRGQLEPPHLDWLARPSHCKRGGSGIMP